jgi:predicted nuclease of predicted toxin-antitoxin system
MPRIGCASWDTNASMSAIWVRSAADHEIVAFATERRATIVTLDADFHAILAVSGLSEPSVIRLRVEGLRAGAVPDLVQRVISTLEADLRRGALITVKARKTTCHKLPIGGFGMTDDKGV